MPAVKPMAAVAQRLAAVVMPLTLSFSAQMVPAPMNPIPATMPAAMRAGSVLKFMETMVKRHEPSETSIWVLSPAGRCASSRSIPTMAPRTTDRIRLRRVSRVSAVCMAFVYAVLTIKIGRFCAELLAACDDYGCMAVNMVFDL